MTDRKQEKVYVILHETIAASLIKDFGSIGSLAGLAYVNHTYCGGAVVYDVVAAILFFGWTFSKVLKKSGVYMSLTFDELREWARRETREAA